MATFSIDTHLFRELGELLVGRDSTALIELIKNSYDADATKVIVVGHRLDQKGSGEITISDNGSGMNKTQFESGFLRIASRIKDDGDRRSFLRKRRYTGAKGIGRLAAHKLARLLEVESMSRDNAEPGTSESVVAVVDWDAIEEFETLDEIDGSKAIATEFTKIRRQLESGTKLKLSRLRRAWTPTERARFFAEVQSFSPPEFLTRPLNIASIDGQLLFEKPIVRSSATEQDTFEVRLEGDLGGGDEYWQLLENQAKWVIEIRSSRDDGKIHYAIAPTPRTLKESPDATTVFTAVDHPNPSAGPFFDARIFLRVGVSKLKTDQRTWASRASGVRVYMEGFRVLPYGEPSDDWLKLDSTYTRRSRNLSALDEFDTDELGLPDDKDAGLTGFPSNNYFGAVFLTQDNAEGLRMLVNREGFVPEGGYDDLVKIVRQGIDLSTRIHAAAYIESRKERGEKRRGEPAAKDESRRESGEKPKSSPGRLKKSLSDATTAIVAARTHLESAELSESSQERGLLAEQLKIALHSLQLEASTADDLISERSLLGVLASVGTQMSAFVHEIRSLLGSSQAVESAFRDLIDQIDLESTDRRKAKKILLAIGDLRRGLEREASYLTDIVSPDARRRRSRQKIAERFDAAALMVANTAARNAISIKNTIPAMLRTPPMFPAEITAIFSNLLSNAIKAAGPDGEILASGNARKDGRVGIKIQNTGTCVNVADSERWFRPFESTTSKSDPVLGQGMGLGLSITRRLLDDYGAEIKFVKAARDFASAVEITFPTES